jgi:hypothetical protein
MRSTARSSPSCTTRLLHLRAFAPNALDDRGIVETCSVRGPRRF